MALPCGGHGGGEDTAAGMFGMWTGVEVRDRGSMMPLLLGGGAEMVGQ